MTQRSNNMYQHIFSVTADVASLVYIFRNRNTYSSIKLIYQFETLWFKIFKFFFRDVVFENRNFATSDFREYSLGRTQSHRTHIQAEIILALDSLFEMDLEKDIGSIKSELEVYDAVKNIFWQKSGPYVEASIFQAFHAMSLKGLKVIILEQDTRLGELIKKIFKKNEMASVSLVYSRKKKILYSKMDCLIFMSFLRKINSFFGESEHKKIVGSIWQDGFSIYKKNTISFLFAREKRFKTLVFADYPEFKVIKKEIRKQDMEDISFVAYPRLGSTNIYVAVFVFWFWLKNIFKTTFPVFVAHELASVLCAFKKYSICVWVEPSMGLEAAIRFCAARCTGAIVVVENRSLFYGNVNLRMRRGCDFSFSVGPGQVRELELVRYGREELVPTGVPVDQIVGGMEIMRNDVKPTETIRVLVFDEPGYMYGLNYADLFFKYLFRWVISHGDRITVVMKPKKNFGSWANCLHLLGANISERLVFLKPDTSVDKALAECDFIISQLSTPAFIAYARRKKVFIFNPGDAFHPRMKGAWDSLLYAQLEALFGAVEQVMLDPEKYIWCEEIVSELTYFDDKEPDDRKLGFLNAITETKDGAPVGGKNVF